MNTDAALSHSNPGHSARPKLELLEQAASRYSSIHQRWARCGAGIRSPVRDSHGVQAAADALHRVTDPAAASVEAPAAPYRPQLDTLIGIPRREFEKPREVAFFPAGDVSGRRRSSLEPLASHVAQSAEPFVGARHRTNPRRRALFAACVSAAVVGAAWLAPMKGSNTDPVSADVRGASPLSSATALAAASGETQDRASSTFEHLAAAPPLGLRRDDGQASRVVVDPGSAAAPNDNTRRDGATHAFAASSRIPTAIERGNARAPEHVRTARTTRNTPPRARSAAPASSAGATRQLPEAATSKRPSSPKVRSAPEKAPRNGLRDGIIRRSPF